MQRGTERILTTHTGATFLAIDPALAWAKLAALTDGARLASERLWT